MKAPRIAIIVSSREMGNAGRLEIGPKMKNKLPLGKFRARKERRVRDEEPQVSIPAEVMHLDTIVRRSDPKAIEGEYRHSPAALHVPGQIDACPGITFFGRHVKSLVFSTDLAIICNCDADAVFAVYPFTCQPVITQALVNASGRPVFTGVAGTTTTGTRSRTMAMQSEMQGAYGVIVNSPTSVEDIHEISRSIDIPLILTVVNFDELIATKIMAGARVVNVAAGKGTPDVVEAIRERFPDLPIIASGGRDAISIKATIDAGADAITWVPPTMQQLQRELMDVNRAAGRPAEPDAVA